MVHNRLQTIFLFKIDVDDDNDDDAVFLIHNFYSWPVWPGIGVKKLPQCFQKLPK